MTNEPEAWLAAIRRGDHAAAWAIGRAALAGRDPATRDDPRLPYHLRWVWDGRPLDGLDVLVRCYHGLGDTLQFARFLPLLRTRARSVSVEMQPRLIPLFAGFPGIDRLIPFDEGAPTPPSGCDIEIMELPMALDAAPDDVPPTRMDVTPAALPQGCVALCWQSGDWDPGRAVPPPLFRALCRPLALSLVTGPTHLPVLNPAGCPMDMPQTARLVAGATLVITVDTMAAHLAGTLGRPTWLLLKHEPDWRWPLGSDATPWYPSMRLYRQRRPGDWAEVVDRVQADLASLDAAPAAARRTA